MEVKQLCTSLGGIHKFGDLRTVKETNARLDFEATCEICGYIDHWWTANTFRQIEELKASGKGKPNII